MVCGKLTVAEPSAERMHVVGVFQFRYLFQDDYGTIHKYRRSKGESDFATSNVWDGCQKLVKNAMYFVDAPLCSRFRNNTPTNNMIDHDLFVVWLASSSVRTNKDSQDLQFKYHKWPQ